MKKVYTASDEFVVFHTSDAGRPDLYEKEGWTFEPTDWNMNEVYAFVYPTLEEALTKAEEFEYKLMQEDFDNICEYVA